MLAIIAFIAVLAITAGIATIVHHNKEIALDKAVAKANEDHQRKLANMRYKSDLGTYYRSQNDNSYGFMLKPEYADYHN